MDELLLKERMESALQSSSPATALAELALSLKTEGMSQQTMYQLFDEYRVRHEKDADSTSYDAVLDTMDIISGFCSKSAQLFDITLKAAFPRSGD